MEGVGEDALARQLGRVVRRRREEHGWSQDELAARSGLHRTFVGAVELGLKVPTLTTVLKLARGLGLPVVDLVRQWEQSLPPEAAPAESGGARRSPGLPPQSGGRSGGER